MKNTVTLDKVTKSYGGLRVLDGYSAAITENTALMGASGKGKTTLLRIIAGLERPDSGEVKFSEKPKLSFVFQEDRLFEDFSAVENITAIIGKGAENERKAAEMLLSLLIDTDEHSGAVRDFSGGMKRRVAIARALLAEHDVLLLDEPFKGLDEDTRDITARVIREHSREKLTLLVTHDTREAELLGIGNVIIVE
jgi:NitT/TauT family transport system ATP-binding protein